MNKSIYLARVIGLYYLITGIFTFVFYTDIDLIIKSFVSQPSLIILVGITTLIVGLLLVVYHNLWVKDWRVVITLIAWLTLIIGVIRLFCYNYIPSISNWVLAHKGFMLIPLIIFFLLGIFLTFKGFERKIQLDQ